MPHSLTFKQLRDANIARNKAVFPQCEEWTTADWLVALTNELGEVADVVKKIRRGDYQIEERRIELGKEIADVVIYCDLLATHLYLDLGKMVEMKWNEVCRRRDFPHSIDEWFHSEVSMREQDDLTFHRRACDGLGDFLVSKNLGGPGTAYEMARRAIGTLLDKIEHLERMLGEQRFSTRTIKVLLKKHYDWACSPVLNWRESVRHVLQAYGGIEENLMLAFARNWVSMVPQLEVEDGLPGYHWRLTLPGEALNDPPRTFATLMALSEAIQTHLDEQKTEDAEDEDSVETFMTQPQSPKLGDGWVDSVGHRLVYGEAADGTRQWFRVG